MTCTRVFISLCLTIVIVGCQSNRTLEPRVPKALHDNVLVSGDYSPTIRAFGDGRSQSIFDHDFLVDERAFESQFPYLVGKELNVLALSGGGEHGAFGIGVLLGWSALETRPEFTIVTGVSAGALIAPFAFLGSDYDERLKRSMLAATHDSLVDERSLLTVLFNDSYTKGDKLQDYVKSYFPDSMIDDIAAEYRKGRRLLLSTTHLDAGRPMTWDIGEIASSGDEGRYDLIRKIIIASASIPGFFPPQIFDVYHNGEEYHEIHVDGGVTRELFYDPLKFDFAKLKQNMGATGAGNVYIIRNGRLRPRAAHTNDKVVPILVRSIDSLVAAQTLGDTYRAYLGAVRDGMKFNLIYIPDEFEEKAKHEMFDSENMKLLFDYAYESVQSDQFWLNSPLHIDPQKDHLAH